MRAVGRASVHHGRVRIQRPQEPGVIGTTHRSGELGRCFGSCLGGRRCLGGEGLGDFRIFGTVNSQLGSNISNRISEQLTQHSWPLQMKHKSNHAFPQDVSRGHQ